MIVVYLNSFMSPQTLRAMPKRLVEAELYRILMHELTHAADVLPARGSASLGTREEFKRKHHNHPAEVKALMRDVVTQVDETVREWMGEGMPFGTALQFALLDSKWVDIKDYLTRKNRNTILKGVYTYFEDRGIGPS